MEAVEDVLFRKRPPPIVIPLFSIVDMLFILNAWQMMLIVAEELNVPFVIPPTRNKKKYVYLCCCIM